MSALPPIAASALLLGASYLLAALPIAPAGSGDLQDGSQQKAGAARIAIPKDLIRFDDGDTIAIQWKDRLETVRILGIDTPEVQHLEHNIPIAQPFGPQAGAYLRGGIDLADKVELLFHRDDQGRPITDRYGRTLGYIYLNGKNYSALVLRAGLAAESVSHYGDNGFPDQAAECLAAAKDQPPLPFEAPHLYRARMRILAEAMKRQGIYPIKTGK